jgi:hypothetical protein
MLGQNEKPYDEEAAMPGEIEEKSGKLGPSADRLSEIRNR